MFRFVAWEAKDNQGSTCALMALLYCCLLDLSKTVSHFSESFPVSIFLQKRQMRQLKMKTAVEQDRHVEEPALHCFGWASDTNFIFPPAYGVHIVIVLPQCGSPFLLASALVRSSLDVLVVTNHHLYKIM